MLLLLAACEFGSISGEVWVDSNRNGVRDPGEAALSGVTVVLELAGPDGRFGTSIADALRVYAAEMRDKRVMRAEQAANKLPTKMTLGTMLFTVPPLLIILVAYLAKFWALGHRPVAAGLDAIPRDLHRAARISGASAPTAAAMASPYTSGL